jgi:hypothetical protein
MQALIRKLTDYRNILPFNFKYILFVRRTPVSLVKLQKTIPSPKVQTPNHQVYGLYKPVSRLYE